MTKWFFSCCRSVLKMLYWQLCLLTSKSICSWQIMSCTSSICKSSVIRLRFWWLSTILWTDPLRHQFFQTWCKMGKCRLVHWISTRCMSWFKWVVVFWSWRTWSRIHSSSPTLRHRHLCRMTSSQRKYFKDCSNFQKFNRSWLKDILGRSSTKISCTKLQFLIKSWGSNVNLTSVWFSNITWFPNHNLTNTLKLIKSGLKWLMGKTSKKTLKKYSTCSQKQNLTQSNWNLCSKFSSSSISKL